jgi:hypothetical protein
MKKQALGVVIILCLVSSIPIRASGFPISLHKLHELKSTLSKELVKVHHCLQGDSFCTPAEIRTYRTATTIIALLTTGTAIVAVRKHRISREQQKKLNIALFVAVSQDKQTDVANLLQQGAPANNYQYPANSALFGVKSTNIAQTLIDAGADINMRTIFNETPLKTALANGNWGVAQLLLSQPTIKVSREFNPINSAVQGKDKLLKDPSYKDLPELIEAQYQKLINLIQQKQDTHQ